MTHQDHWLEMIQNCAEKYKNKLTAKEFLDILFTGDATGDGRLESYEIKEVVVKVLTLPDNSTVE